MILHTKKLCKSFSNGGLQQHVIKNLDIEIREKDFTVIMGASGSGKSTLLYALSGMDTPTLGSVFFGDTDISKFNNDQLAIFRRENCGFVFQSIYLLENMTVFDNVMTGALALQKNSPELVKKAEGLLKTDIGIYKALGFSSGSLRLQFALRFLIVALTGIVIGTALSLSFSEKLLSYMLRSMGIASFVIDYRFATVFMPIAATALGFFVFAYITAARIKKVEIRTLITE